MGNYPIVSLQTSRLKLSFDMRGLHNVIASTTLLLASGKINEKTYLTRRTGTAHFLTSRDV